MRSNGGITKNGKWVVERREKHGSGKQSCANETWWMRGFVVHMRGCGVVHGCTDERIRSVSVANRRIVQERIFEIGTE